MGDLEERIERHTGGRAPRKPAWSEPLLALLLITLGVIVGGIVAGCADKWVRPAVVGVTEDDSAETEEPPSQEPKITIVEVAPGVLHLDFGGEYCDTAECLKRATGLVLERTPGHRIVSVAAIGVYGSPTALAIVTGHTYE